MKKKIKTIGYAALAIFIFINTVFILCATLAGPLMIGWNWSFGLFSEPVTYIKCLKIVVGFVTVIATLVAATSLSKNKGDRNG